MKDIVHPAAAEQLIYLIPALPLAGALICGFFGARMKRSDIHLVALGAVGASFTVSVGAMLAVLGSGTDLSLSLYTWMALGELAIDVRFLVDPLSAIMLLVVTGVSFLIHVYSTGYMAHDPAFHRYFAYLNLFVAFMTILVLADSMPVLFVGWEGVGLSSYLLIGFWYSDGKKAIAGKKAFIVNRIGDFGFLLGMVLLFGLLGTFSMSGMREAVSGIGPDDIVPVGVFFGNWSWSAAMGIAFLLILLGCTGKSAQIPLFVWLPDAMAGPTPVSALIHAATMVTAGVYVLARLSFLLSISPHVMAVIAILGAATAFLGAFMALFQNGIKKVLAYSTISQLGFMFIGTGVGAFHAGVYHLFTHAFFKACLFLCAGSVIHSLEKGADILRRAEREKNPCRSCRAKSGMDGAMLHKSGSTGISSENEDEDSCAHAADESVSACGCPDLQTDTEDIRLMGGLREKLPHTHLCFLIAAMAITGIPPLSGFFSKDIILHAAFTHDLGLFNSTLWFPWLLWSLGSLAALMTAIYMWRLYYLVFRGDPREKTLYENAHESPLSMIVPLWILAALSAISMVFGLAYLFGHNLSFAAWLSDVTASAPPTRDYLISGNSLLAIAALVALAGFWLAGRVWGPEWGLEGDDTAKSRLGFVFRASRARLWWDEAYEIVFVKPLMYISGAVWWFVDVLLIDRFFVDGTAKTLIRAGRKMKTVQGGNAQTYAVVILAGSVILAGILIFARIFAGGGGT